MVKIKFKLSIELENLVWVKVTYNDKEPLMLMDLNLLEEITLL